MVFELRRGPAGEFCFPYVSEGVQTVFYLSPADVASDEPSFTTRISPFIPVALRNRPISSNVDGSLAASLNAGITIESSVPTRVCFDDQSGKWFGAAGRFEP